MRQTHFLLLAIIFFSSITAAQSRVRRIQSSSVFEGDRVKVFARNYNNAANPLTVSLVDGSGNVFASNIGTSRKKNSFTFIAPTVTRTRTLQLRVSGGDVPSTTPETFGLVIYNAPDLSNPDPDSPEGQLEVTNLTTDTITFSDSDDVLESNAQGDLLWDGNKFIDENGSLFSDRLVLDELSLQISNQGTLLWNSHNIITDQGVLAATELNSLLGKTGDMTLYGNGSIQFNTYDTLNQGLVMIESSQQGGTLHLPPSGQVLTVLRGEFDTEVDTGVVGTTDLRNALLPANARVTRAWYEVIETFTSASDASNIGISIPVDDVNGILAPIAINDVTDPWDQGAHLAIQSGLLTNMSEKTTDKRNVQLSITGEALTDGKVVVFVEYMVLP